MRTAGHAEARPQRGSPAAFEVDDLRQVIISTDQPGRPPLGQLDASAIVALDGVAFGFGEDAPRQKRMVRRA
jgi:hypothetical protein